MVTGPARPDATLPDPRLVALLYAGIAAVAVFSAATLDVVDVDEAQYASIAREMLDTGSFLVVKHRGQDYLDKPPLLFWLAALSFKLFGYTALAYRLPALLSTVVGVFSADRLGTLLHNRRTGLLAGLMMASTQAYLLHLRDVRTDTMQANAIIFATWQLAVHLRSQTWRSLVLGSVGIGVAMLAKGPLGLVLPGLALGTQVVYARQWRAVWRWQWLVGLGVVALVLAPMCWGLYTQFDLRPDATLYGEKNVSGLRFFFWDQSFGRLTGSNPFLKHSGGGALEPFNPTGFFLWMFLPWTVLAGWGLARTAWRLWTRTTPRPPELLTAGGLVLTVLALSLSRFTLPHYLLVVIPLASILAAAALDDWLSNPPPPWMDRLLGLAHGGLSAALWAVPLLTCTWAFPMHSAALWAFAAAALVVYLIALLPRNPAWLRRVLPHVVVITSANFLLNAHFFPEVFKYHSGRAAALYIQEQGLPQDRLVLYGISSHSFEFTLRRIIPDADDLAAMQAAVAQRGEVLAYMPSEAIQEFQDAGLRVEVLTRLPHYRVTLMRKDFLDPDTRGQVVRERVVAWVRR